MKKKIIFVAFYITINGAALASGVFTSGERWLIILATIIVWLLIDGFLSAEFKPYRATTLKILAMVACFIAAISTGVWAIISPFIVFYIAASTAYKIYLSLVKDSGK